MKLLLLLMCLCILPAYANENSDAGTTKKTKNFQETFGVSKSDRLEIENKFGSITVTHWSRNEVSIKVTAEVESSSASYAADQLNSIVVRMEKFGSTVSARTSFVSTNNGSGQVKYNRINVRYEVSMPLWLTCELKQKYGSIYMPESNPGKCILDSKYGSVTGGDFSGDLSVDVKYGDMKIGNVSSIELTLGYCNNSEIGNANVLNADVKYSTLRMGKVEKLVIDARYSKLKAVEIGTADTELKYTNFKLGRLRRALQCTALSYGTFDIDNLSPDFKNIEVDSRYGTLNIGLPATASFRVKAIEMKYGHCVVSGFDVRHRSESSSESSGFDSRKMRVNSYDLEVNGARGGVITFQGNNYSNINVKAK